MILHLHNTKNKLSRKIQPIYNAINKNKSGEAINTIVGKIATRVSSPPTVEKSLKLQQGPSIVFVNC